jgi:hypothetical protein
MALMVTNLVGFGASNQTQLGGQNATFYDPIGGADYTFTDDPLTPVTNGKVITVSAWVKYISMSVGTMFSVSANAVDPRIRLYDSSSKSRLQARNTAGTIILEVNGDTVLTTGNWYHLLYSADLGNTLSHFYLDDTEDQAVGPTLTDDTIPFDHTVARTGSVYVSSNPLDAHLSELWIDNSYIDFSVASNRRKFITSGGDPVYLGMNGELPTGSTPLLFAPDGNPANNNFGATQTFENTVGSLTAVDGPNP